MQKKFKYDYNINEADYNINEAINDIKKIIQNSTYNLDLEDNGDINGMSYGSYNPVDIMPNSKNFDWTTFIHEYNHNISPLGYNHPDNNYITNNNLNESTYGIKQNTYLDSPSEIRSRLMEFRQENNLSPDKRDYEYDENFINTYRESLKKHKLDRYGKNITRLLNETAYVKLNNQDLYYAKKGTKLIPKKRY